MSTAPNPACTERGGADASGAIAAIGMWLCPSADSASKSGIAVTHVQDERVAITGVVMKQLAEPRGCGWVWSDALRIVDLKGDLTMPLVLVADGDRRGWTTLRSYISYQNAQAAQRAVKTAQCAAKKENL